MKANMGGLDRLVRIAVAVVVAALILMGQLTGLAAIILGVVAGIFVLTSLVSFCPLYMLFGFSTCARKTV